MKTETAILIVGAGAAGLMAAYTLGKAGKKVIILEAQKRIGGRVYPLDEQIFGYPAQGGAEFIHGPAPLTRALIREAGMHTQEEGEWWHVMDGEPKMFTHDSAPDPILLEKLRLLSTDIPVTDFFNAYLPALEHEDLKKRTYRRIEGYFAGDPAKTSSFALRDELEEAHTDGGDGNTPFKEGYGALMDYLLEKCRSAGVEVIFGKEVAALEWGSPALRAVCADHSSYEAQKVIITVPVSLIPGIAYTPALPSVIRAAKDIGFGDVVKILCKFKTRWWEHARGADLTRMYFMLSYEEIPSWWTTPEPCPVLTGWIAGPRATLLAQKEDSTITTIAIDSLSRIFGAEKDKILNELEHTEIVKWPKDPYSKGAYSYPTPASEAAIHTLRQPIEGKLFFAGEALSLYEITGTVEAALQSGLEVAEVLLKGL